MYTEKLLPNEFFETMLDTITQSIEDFRETQLNIRDNSRLPTSVVFHDE